MKCLISLKEAKKIADKLKINLNVYPLPLWRYAMCVEMEHGIHKKTNVVKGNLLTVGKIALAHILEFPDYYQRLELMEKNANLYWKNKKKTKILLS